MNIATGHETSVRHLAELLGVEVLQGPSRVGEIPRSCLATAAAHRRLGWSAQTPLRAGLASLRAVPAESV